MNRKPRTLNWSKSLILIVKMKAAKISRDGKYLFCTSKEVSRGSNIFVHSGRDANTGIHSASVLNVEGITGRRIYPRNVAPTNELVFAGGQRVVVSN